MLLAMSAPALAQGESVEVWTRRAGNHSLGAPLKKVAPRTIVLKNLKKTTRKGIDVQLGVEKKYRGVTLRYLLRRSGHRTGDAVILYFKNGLMIPVPRAALKDLDIFVATDVRTKKRKKRRAKWSSNFGTVDKPGSVSVDPRPVTFGANKIVVQTPRLPGLIDPSGESFSPWRFADTLVGIEVINQDAWDHQFTAAQAKKERIAKLVVDGKRIYLKACQYCHGARDVGSTYGWDFMVPLPMYSLKKPRDLYEHVTVEPYQRNERGLMMPTHGNLSKRDVAAVWAWNKMLAKTEELNDYQPDLFAD